jgi:hypothetical protein
MIYSKDFIYIYDQPRQGDVCDAIYGVSAKKKKLSKG